MSVSVDEERGGMFCLGLNYRTSSVAVRERFSVGKSRLAEAVASLHSLPGVEECVLLSTCNRTEVYYWTRSEEATTAAILRYFLGEAADAAGLGSFFYLHRGEMALFHLARVASGLDSMVIGETEIFGQLKDAYRVALQAGATGRGANRVFQRIFSIGKKVRSSTRITAGPTSVGAAAVQMAHDILGHLDGARVLVVGAGDVARSTAQSLRSRGAEGIFVANRSYERAVELASQVGGKVIRFSEWIPYVEQIDIVIVSTAAPVYVVSPSSLEKVQEARRGRPLFLIDLSVPRNVDPACAEMPGVYVYDMDAMEQMATESRRARAGEIARCESLIHLWMEENRADLLGEKQDTSHGYALCLGEKAALFS